MALMKNFLRASISSIAYHRKLFPEKSFVDSNVGGLSVKRIDGSTGGEKAQRLLDWLDQGVFDALQKKYLEELVFQICVKDPSPKSTANQLILEAFSFKFTYGGGSNPQVSMIRGGRPACKVLNGTEDLKKYSTEVLGRLVDIAASLNPLPEAKDLFISFKLLYFDDVTPKEYEPPFFAAMKRDEPGDGWFSENVLRFDGNGLATPYHALNMSIMSSKFEDKDSGIMGSSGQTLDVEIENANTLNICEPRQDGSRSNEPIAARATARGGRKSSAAKPPVAPASASKSNPRKRSIVSSPLIKSKKSRY